MRNYDIIMYAKYATLLGLILLFSPFAFGERLFDYSTTPADCDYRSYVHLLKEKKVAVIVNQTSFVGDSSLVDILMVRGIKVVKIFVPEHGFRGTEDAGATIESSVDNQTKLPVISLYGKHKKPTKADLDDVDVVVYDLQDVGVRFYTYISTLQYCMEACAAEHKSFVVLDKPDPNGFYIDGPVLEKSNNSFVGMQPIPVVYGMTPGEYAMMLKGEEWFAGAKGLDLRVVKCLNYDHRKKYELPVAPSPNLRNMASIYAYPSLCLFEGTVISVGRGTDKPFQQYGSPAFKGSFSDTFTPVATAGAKHPLYEHVVCYGAVVGSSAEQVLNALQGHIKLTWLRDAYAAYPVKDSFFNSFFTKLSGTKLLEQQIKGEVPEQAIRETWAEDIRNFKVIRRKYLLYKDFE